MHIDNWCSNGKVISPTSPVDDKFPLEFTIFYTIEIHLYDFRSTLSYGSVDNAISTAVFNLEGSNWLGMTYIGEDGMYHGLLADIKKGSTNFSFVGRIENHNYDEADYMNSAIHRREKGVGARCFTGI